MSAKKSSPSGSCVGTRSHDTRWSRGPCGKRLMRVPLHTPASLRMTIIRWPWPSRYGQSLGGAATFALFRFQRGGLSCSHRRTGQSSTIPSSADPHSIYEKARRACEPEPPDTGPGFRELRVGRRVRSWPGRHGRPRVPVASAPRPPRPSRSTPRAAAAAADPHPGGARRAAILDRLGLPGERRRPRHHQLSRRLAIRARTDRPTASNTSPPTAAAATLKLLAIDLANDLAVVRLDRRDGRFFALRRARAERPPAAGRAPLFDGQSARSRLHHRRGHV